MKNFLVLSVISVCTALYGQAPPPGPPGPPMHGMGMGPHEFGMWMRGKVVTGAPYTADVTDTMNQTLADGNTIQRTTTGKVARDSQGRTYMQETITGGPLAANGAKTLTFVTDPVAGYVYVINSTNKTAIRRPFKAPPANAANQPPKPPRDSADVVETDLGKMTVAGVTAQGTSRTRTIPAGAIGNASPITSTNEVWRSQALQIVVKAIHTDPRIGTSTYQLSNIQTGAPPASLFQVPQGYTISDAPVWRGLRGQEPPPPPEQ